VTAINILLAALGGSITLMVIVGMVLITPRGAEVHVETAEHPTAPVAQPPVPEPDPGLLPTT
jgi:hypothetical protein